MILIMNRKLACNFYVNEDDSTLFALRERTCLKATTDFKLLTWRNKGVFLYDHIMSFLDPDPDHAESWNTDDDIDDEDDDDDGTDWVVGLRVLQ